jgi:hypothetical protein
VVPCGGFFVATVVFVVFELVFGNRLVVPCGEFFVATVVFVVFELVFGNRLVVPCGGFFVVTVIFVVFRLVSSDRLVVPCGGFFVESVVVRAVFWRASVQQWFLWGIVASLADNYSGDCTVDATGYSEAELSVGGACNSDSYGELLLAFEMTELVTTLLYPGENDVRRLLRAVDLYCKAVG